MLAFSCEKPSCFGQEIKEMEDEPTEDWKAEVPRSAVFSLGNV